MKYTLFLERRSEYYDNAHLTECFLCGKRFKWWDEDPAEVVPVDRNREDVMRELRVHAREHGRPARVVECVAP